EEITHTLGVDVLKDSQNINSYFDSEKYTVTSYKRAPGMEVQGDPYDFFDVSAYTLQLFDIAALQEIYGRNYAKAAGAGSVWNVSAMNYSTDLDDAFLYTIWDGGGLNDVIDASELDNYSFTEGVEIDLRQGRFSSIGEDVYGSKIIWDVSASASDPDPGNVAIAFYTVIENAIGTNLNDTLIGNAWNNKLEGGIGNDHLYGDGVVSPDNDQGFLGLYDFYLGEYYDPLRAWGQDNIQYSADLSGNDHLIGGAGHDHLYGGAGQDILDGGIGSDFLFGGTNAEGSSAIERDVADYSNLSGSISVSLSSDVNYDFTVTASNGDVDNLSEIEVIKGTSGDDTIDFSSITTSNIRVYNEGENHIISFTEGEENKVFFLEDFENIILNDQDSVIRMGGIGGIHVNAGEGDDTVFLVQRGAHSGEGLFVNDLLVYNTVDNTSYSYVEKFEDVEYAHISTLGHNYSVLHSYHKPNHIDYSGLDSSSSGITIDSIYGNSLVVSTNSSASNDVDIISNLPSSSSSSSALYVTGTDYGDTVSANASFSIVNGKFFSGNGDDNVYYTNEFYYGGGNDVVWADDIYLPGNISISDISGSWPSIYATTFILNLPGNNSITSYIPSDPDAYTISPTFHTYNNSGNHITVRYLRTGRGVLEITDEVNGGTGFGTHGNDNINVTSSISSPYDVQGYAGDDVITVDSSSTNGHSLHGGSGTDTITGALGNDFLHGDSGDDILNGGAGNDTLYGGSGDDVIDGGEGDDDHAFYGYNTSAIHVNLSLTGANVDDVYNGVIANNNETLINVENVTGTVFDDVIIGNEFANDLHGLQGDDKLTGGAGSDKFFIGSGLDVITDFKSYENEIISVEYRGVKSINDIEIVYTDTDVTLAEIYVKSNGEKIAKIYMVLGDRINENSFQYETYKEPDASTSANNNLLVDPDTGELVFGNNYNSGDYQRVIIENPADWGTSLSDYANPNSNEINSFMWEQIQYHWRDGFIGNVSLFEHDAVSFNSDGDGGLFTSTDVSFMSGHTVINLHGDSIYNTVYNGTGSGSKDGSSSVASFPRFGTGNDNTFVFYENNQDVSTETIVTVYEEVNAGFDIIRVDGSSVSDVYLSTNYQGDFLINFYSSSEYKIRINARYIANHGNDATERIELIKFDDGEIDISNGV
ncbi:MAG: M10 family metallopeptidase C-terminal domain-containing protein, partial [Cycloclasticus sp.]|nr:M10 family metallopeptidase C-terminal domain-containing protein [Cycloclasticus sp.]